MKNAASKKPFAKKSFGQNFLSDQNYVQKIIDALDPQADETIIEIGAGRGALTEKLVERDANIIAIELDRELIPLLEEQFSGCKDFQLFGIDALKVNFEEIIAQNPHSALRAPQSKLVANLPYHISTAILQKLIEQREVFSAMVLMFQREVVERIMARPGNSERGFLTVLVEAYFKIEKLFEVPPTAFRPAPKVWSAVVRLKPKKAEDIDPALFREVVSTGFAQKRKTILNNLKNKFGDAAAVLELSSIEPRRRAETLTLEEWKILAKQIKS